MIETNSVFSLGAAIIARDAASTLERTLRSILPYVRQIVMVDTGSVDGTPQIAAKFGVDVYYHKWRESFSEARNYALRQVNTDWILNIDTDEELTKFTPIDAFSNADYGGINLIINNKLAGDGSEYLSAHRYTRIVRNRSDIFYTGRIHEQISDRITGAGLMIFESDFEILHHGYLENDTRRSDRNIDMLLRELEENPEDGFIEYHLGQSYFAKGDTGNAAIYFQRSLSGNDLSHDQNDLAKIRLAQIALGKNDFITAIELTNNKFTGDDIDAFRRYVRGAAMLNLGNFSEAAALYKTLLSKNYNYINYNIINQLLGQLEGVIKS